jgi:hypothetical protein
MNSKPLNDTHRARTVQALNETYALLNKELNYMPHLRKQETIEFYFAHIKKLNAMLDGVKQ